MTIYYIYKYNKKRREKYTYLYFSTETLRR